MITRDVGQEGYDRQRLAGKGPHMNATMEAQIIAAIERASVTAARAVLHERMALRTAFGSTPKVCRGCGETVPARALVNVSPVPDHAWPIITATVPRPRWLCPACAREAGR